MLRKFTRAILAAATLAAFVSCGKNDLNETPGFNRETIRGYMMDRAANVDKLPVLIEEISPIQKIALRGETLSTCVVATRAEGPSGISLFYFVFSPDGRTFLSGKSNLLKEIDANGYQATLEQINAHKKTANN